MVGQVTKYRKKKFRVTEIYGRWGGQEVQKLAGKNFWSCLPFLCSLSRTPPPRGDGGGGGYNQNFTFKVKANFGCTPATTAASFDVPFYMSSHP